MEQQKPKIICLTPIKNEAWILDKFLKSTSLWADYIIIADQQSTDESREICKKYEKVILVHNDSPAYNESRRQQLLISEARKIEGPRLLITLDADEIVSPNFETSAEWNTMLNAKPGTIFEFQWANMLPDSKEIWLDLYHSWGYMDDNSEHTGNLIHSARIPLPENHDRIKMTDIKILHFQYVDWNRMKCKHYWYQCFELINKVNHPVDIFRKYHHMYAVDKSKIKPLPQEWIDDYRDKGIDITSVYKQSMLYWEKQVLDYMDQYGVPYFSHLDIWTVSWVEIARKWNYPNPEKYGDPRNKWEKVINKWLIKTQIYQYCFFVRKIDTVLKIVYK